MHLVAPGALKRMLMLPSLQSSEEASVEAQALVPDVIGCFKPHITEVAVSCLYKVLPLLTTCTRITLRKLSLFKSLTVIFHLNSFVPSGLARVFLTTCKSCPLRLAA